MVTIRNQDDFDALTPADRLRYERALRAYRLMSQEGVDVENATALVGSTVADLEEFLGGVLRTDASGKRLVRHGHHAPLPFKIPTPTGTRLVWVADPMARSLLGGYNHAVIAALAGEEYEITAFEGRVVVIDGERIPLITDPLVLGNLAHAGEVGFEDIYDLT